MDRFAATTFLLSITALILPSISRAEDNIEKCNMTSQFNSAVDCNCFAQTYESELGKSGAANPASLWDKLAKTYGICPDEPGIKEYSQRKCREFSSFYASEYNLDDLCGCASEQAYKAYAVDKKINYTGLGRAITQATNACKKIVR